MPKLKQPTSLEKMAKDIFFKRADNCCVRLSFARSLEELEQTIAFIKEAIFSDIPWIFLADFCSKFLEKFYSIYRPASHCRAALQIMMDLDIEGLELTGPITKHLDFTIADRLKKLQKLDLKYMFRAPYTSKNLENFYLNDLKTFIFEGQCSDLDLKIIGEKCTQLEVLKVENSERVTNTGLAALSSCAKLRVINFYNCSITHNAYNNFLAEHKNIKELTCGENFVARIDISEYEAMNRLILKLDNARTEEILTIVEKFPNLTYFEIHGIIPDDLSPLKSLEKLQVLAINYDDYSMYDSTIGRSWLSIKEVLTSVGANITRLEFSVMNIGIWNQADLDFIFQYCPNIEYLKYVHPNGLVVVPGFPKLKTLVPSIVISFKPLEIPETPEIDFETLLELEYLSLENFDVSFRVIESIMLDHDRFPKLSVVKTCCMKPEDILKIERIARENNLDFRIDNNRKSNWLMRHRLGLPPL